MNLNSKHIYDYYGYRVGDHTRCRNGKCCNLISVGCVQWDFKSTKLFNKKETLEEILRKIEELLLQDNSNFPISNVGGGYELYAGIHNGKNTFRTLTAADGIIITQNAETIQIGFDTSSIPPQGVTSVAMTVPTGFTVGGSPIESTGTFALNYAAGYTGYTTAEQNKLAGIEAGAQVNVPETDPTVPNHVKAITSTQVSNWDTAFGWGNHATAGYLTSFTETDPTVPSWAKQPNKPDYSWSEILNKPSFHTVATTGNYEDLENLPTIPEPIWTWDAVNGNMSVIDSSGVNNTGQSTFFVGNGAGDNNSAYGTIGIGYQTVQNQARTYNIGIGTQSGQNYSGENAVLIGYQAGQNSGALNLVAIGLEAAKEFKGVNDGSVVAIGEKALATPTTTGFSLSQGKHIVAIGTDAAKNIASSNRDVYIGWQAGRDAGVAATANNQSSANNVGIGISALRGVVGTENIGIGGGYDFKTSTPLGAGRNLKGSFNILLGTWAATGAQGNSNIIMGYFVEPDLVGSCNIILQGEGQVPATGTTLRNTLINSRYGNSIISAQAKNFSNKTIIGQEVAIHGDGTTRKLAIYPKTVDTVPRERLDLGDGYMVSAGTKVDQGSFQVILDANTLTADRNQKYPDANGTFALVEETGKRVVIDLDEFTLPAAISAGAQNSFAPINILTVCPSIDTNYIDWEITWKESGVMHKISALDDFTIQLKWTPENCFQLTGLTKADSRVSVNKGNSPKLILRY